MLELIPRTDATRVLFRGNQSQYPWHHATWLVDNREATLDDLSNNPQYLLDPHGGSREAAEKDGQCTEHVYRNIKGPKVSRKPRNATTIQDNGTPSSSDGNSPWSQRSWAKVVSQVVSPLSSHEYDAGSSFMDIGMYCLVCHSTIRIISESNHLKKDTQFVRARIKNYEARFRKNGNHRRDMRYAASRQSPPSSSTPAAQE